MLINHTLLLVIAVLVGLSLAWFSFRFFMKRKKYVTGGFVGFFLGAIPATGIIMMNSRAYVVHGAGDYTQYAVYGEPSYTLQNGKSIDVKVPMQKCIIINDSKEEMVVETIVYGYGAGGNDALIEPGGSFVMKHAMTLDYFFDQQPPRQIESKSSGAEIKYWLRTRKAYDKDHPYSMDADEVEALKEKLEERLEDEGEEEGEEEEAAEGTAE